MAILICALSSCTIHIFVEDRVRNVCGCRTIHIPSFSISSPLSPVYLSVLESFYVGKSRVVFFFSCDVREPSSSISFTTSIKFLGETIRYR